MSTCTTLKHVLRWPGQNTCTSDTAGLIPAERKRRTRCFCWDYFQRWINPHVAAGRWTRDSSGHWHVWIVSGRRCSSETSEADRALLVWELFMSTGKYKLQVKPVTADVWSLITLVYFIFESFLIFCGRVLLFWTECTADKHTKTHTEHTQTHTNTHPVIKYDKMSKYDCEVLFHFDFILQRV